ncbi:hypothetical protein PC129_g13314 [Phytophthora cactorum]|uniref:Uncharacterized protein n=1 Tax=Phytophthora cactorum TaxID=29920 RepID=A0A329SIG7_9STRA|nr:hypothetical protein PC114_g15598 [Phytophthora cactorum]KAG2925933.1 hypothetical protein PC117_g15045 [Phytophthora cactorum]KAG3215811.1 hypothetical protein PC129_g13314 [Phytophthora cactorum]KAG4243248.1 hypothetical protein PC116_g8896 [Phytophthora cactorum]RAW36505.1 hypothetical protein PC110_g7227 [Phytophthora cactorum]
MATRAALGRVFSSRSNPKSALALSFIEEAEDGAESFDRRCFLSVRGDGEACAAEGRSGRFGSDDDDSSVAKTIGAVLSRRHSLVEGFGNPRGCHQRHDGESGVAGDEQYRLSSGRGPGFEGGQTQLYQRVPKRSFNSKFATPMETVNLDNLQLFVDMDRLDTSNKITIRSL